MNVDQKFGLALLIFCLVFWFFVIPTQVAGMREAIYPQSIIIWIAISSVLLILKSWKGASKKILHKSQNEKGIVRVIAIATLCLVYILMINFLGFFISSFVFLVILMLSFGIRDWKILITIPIIFLLFLYILFEKLLVFPLPKGIIF